MQDGSRCIFLTVFSRRQVGYSTEYLTEGIDVVIARLIDDLIDRFSTAFQMLPGVFYLYSLYVFHYGGEIERAYTKTNDLCAIVILVYQPIIIRRIFTDGFFEIDRDHHDACKRQAEG